MPVVRRAIALLLACVLLASCRVDAAVDIDVADDGSGSVAVAVTFDADAAARVADLDGLLRTDDLASAGWAITGPDEQPDGSVVVRAEKPFASPDQLPAVLAEVSPAFTSASIERRRSFGELQWVFDGAVDFTGGAEQFGDDQLSTLLGGRPLGRDVATIEQETGTTVADATGLVLDVSLPGETTEQWSFRLDQPGAQQLHLTSTIEEGSAKVWALVAAVGAALLVLVVLVWIVRGGRRRSPRASRSPRVDPTVMDVEVPAAEVAPTGRRLQLVITAAHGVLWEDHERAAEWLVSIASMQGAEVTTDAALALRREAMLGRISTATFWRSLGVPGDPVELDAAYAARFTIAPEVVDFVTLLARRGVGVACITNDTVEWSSLLRIRFGLDRFIRPWVVSAELGAMAPAVAPFEEVAQRAGIEPDGCMYIDSHVDSLDTAKRLGMATVLLGPPDAAARAAGHQNAPDLRALLARPRGADDVR
jgi:putative hydrolase of the HAD superfamily